MVMGGEGYEDQPHHPQHDHLHDDDIEGTCQCGQTRSWPARQRSTWLDGLCIGDIIIMRDSKAEILLKVLIVI